MILEGLHEKEIFTGSIPFRIAVNTQDNFNYPFHWHNAVELIYAAENTCTVNVNNKEYTLIEKDILLVAAGDIHSFRSTDTGKWYFIQFDSKKLFGFSDTASYKAYQYRTEMISQTDNITLHQELENQIVRIIAESDTMGFACDLFLNARFLDITVILSRHLINTCNINNYSNRAYDLTKVDKAFEYIEKNYHRQISLSEVSKAVGFSEYYFSRVFKKVTEKNFHNYLNEYRVKKAEKLLFEETTITEAAYSSGFNSIVTFNRIFKQVKGCSPSEYIKRRV